MDPTPFIAGAVALALVAFAIRLVAVMGEVRRARHEMRFDEQLLVLVANSKPTAAELGPLIDRLTAYRAGLPTSPATQVSTQDPGHVNTAASIDTNTADDIGTSAADIDTAIDGIDTDDPDDLDDLDDDTEPIVPRQYRGGTVASANTDTPDGPGVRVLDLHRSVPADSHDGDVSEVTSLFSGLHGRVADRPSASRARHRHTRPDPDRSQPEPSALVDRG